jgi:hypothetical protein
MFYSLFLFDSNCNLVTLNNFNIKDENYDLFSVVINRFDFVGSS